MRMRMMLAALILAVAASAAAATSCANRNDATVPDSTQALPDQIAAIDALDTGVCGSPDPEIVGTKMFNLSIPDRAKDLL